MRLLIVVATLLLAGCESIEPYAVVPLIPQQSVHLTTFLGSQSLLHPLSRPAAILGLFVTHHLAYTPTSSAPNLSIIGILQQEQLLHERTPPERGALASLEELSAILQVDIPDLLNRSQNRADTLNAYIGMLEQTLSEAQLQKTLIDTFLDEIRMSFSTTKKELSAEQKKQNKAMKDHRFTEASTIQERLLEFHRNLTDVELKKNEAENMEAILSEMIEISEHRLMALQENRKILIVGLSIKELPGIDDLGIIQTNKKRRLFQ